MKVAILGCGARHRMYREALLGRFRTRHQLVALCDTNPVRAALSARATPDIPAYPIAAFPQMIAETQADCVIIATPDHLHADHICMALEAGCDVICEKPLTIDAPSLRRIVQAQARCGKRVTVTFNYRFAPPRAQIREIIASGQIGEVLAVEFSWHLDRIHGADYFRRWHRQKARSGGLFVHKASHHFDLLNWWLDSRPEEVSAMGARRFYTPRTADALGLTDRAARCTDCPARPRCEYALDLGADDALRHLYQEAEAEDGYHRDQCVFSADHHIEDVMQAQIGYASGASAVYSLTAFAPWEGLELRFHGSKGQLWHRHIENHGILGGTRPPDPPAELFETVLHRARKAPQPIEIPPIQGDHGGADPLMLEALFGAASQGEDRTADHRAGAWSALTGIAANLSVAEGRRINIPALLETEGIRL